MEADFRFSLARLREYSEQVALLGGERAEQNHARRDASAAIIANFLALVFRRMRLLAFTQIYGQLSPIIPYHLHRAVLFCRHDPARHHDADRQAFGHGSKTR